MENCNQIDKIIKITKHKYLSAIVPIILIVSSFSLSFVLNENSNTDLLQKILSVIGLVLYIFVSLTHRIGKQNCVIEDGEIYSPISGKIKEIKNSDGFTEIILKKNLFDRCDIRSCEGISFGENPFSEEGTFFSWEVVSGKIFVLGESKIPKGIIAFSTGILTVKLKGNFKAKVDIGEKVIAGDSILGEKIENS